MLIEVIDSSSSSTGSSNDHSKSKSKIIKNNNKNTNGKNNDFDNNDNDDDCNNIQQQHIPTIPTAAEHIVDNDKNDSGYDNTIENENENENENEIQKLIYNTIQELYQTTTTTITTKLYRNNASKSNDIDLLSSSSSSSLSLSLSSSSQHNNKQKHHYKYTLLDSIRSCSSKNTTNDTLQNQLHIIQELLLEYKTKIRIDIFSSTLSTSSSTIVNDSNNNDNDNTVSFNHCMSNKEQKIIQKIKQQQQVQVQVQVQQNELLSIELLCTNYQILIEQAVTTLLSECTDHNNTNNNITNSSTTTTKNHHSITNIDMNSIYNVLHLLAHDISVLTSLLFIQLNKLIIHYSSGNQDPKNDNNDNAVDNNNTSSVSSIYLSILQIINVVSSLLRLMANTIHFIHIIIHTNNALVVSSSMSSSSDVVVPVVPSLSESLSSLTIVLSRCICSLLILSEEQQHVIHHDDTLKEQTHINDNPNNNNKNDSVNTIQLSLNKQSNSCAKLLRQLMVLSDSSCTIITSANQQYQRLLFLFSNTQQQQQGKDSIGMNDDTIGSSISSYPIFIQSLSNLSQNVVQETVPPSTTNNTTPSSSSSMDDKDNNVTTAASTIATSSTMDETIHSKEHNANNTKSKSTPSTPSTLPSWTILEPIIQHVFWPSIENNESESISCSNIIDDDDNNNNNDHNNNQRHFCINDHLYDSLLSSNIATTATQHHNHDYGNHTSNNNNATTTTTLSNEWMTLQESIQMVWKNLYYIVLQLSSHKKVNNNNSIVTVLDDNESRKAMKQDNVFIHSSSSSSSELVQSSITENSKNDEIHNDWIILFWKELDKRSQQKHQEQEHEQPNMTNSSISRSATTSKNVLPLVTIDTISTAIRSHYFGRDDTIDTLYGRYSHHYIGKKNSTNNKKKIIQACNRSSSMLVGQEGASIDKWIDNDNDDNGASVIEYIHLGRVISKKQHEQINTINETKAGTKGNVSDRTYLESHISCLYTTIRYLSHLSSSSSKMSMVLLKSTTTFVSELLPICYDLLSSSNDDDIGLGAAFIYHLLPVTYYENSDEVVSSLSTEYNNNRSSSTNRILYDIASNLITALYDRIKTCRVGRTLVLLGMAQCTLFRILIQQYEYNNNDVAAATTTNDSTTKQQQRQQHDTTDQSLLHEIKHNRRLATQQWILILDRNRTSNDNSLLLGILLGGIVPLLYDHCMDSTTPYDSLELGRSSLAAILPLIRCENAVMDNILHNASQQLKQQCSLNNRRLIEEIIETTDDDTNRKQSTDNGIPVAVNSTMIYTTIRLVSIAAFSNTLIGSYPIMKRHGGKIISELISCIERTKRYIINNNTDNYEELSHEQDFIMQLQRKLLYHTEEAAILSLKICGEKAYSTLANILKQKDLDAQFYEKEFYTTVHQLLRLSTNNTQTTTKCLS